MFLFKELAFIKAGLSCQRDSMGLQKAFTLGKSSGWLDLICRLREDNSVLLPLGKLYWSP